ncbi:hypothetical protein [Puia dinghuensis]|uniref:Sulfatase N-terminal domain-containing protein n=1 Tax=Puia dinghuensis TaxID=1792502 RepID=A0A8J2XQY8_9BACT|nr:hypothetical protein [Puia dinghuensis]GGA87033.1 hypothetical protein GCM10011511_07660 [Puia dinghuensis]
MKIPAANRSFFLFLFPLFFVFHGFVRNARFIRVTDCLVLTGAYFLAALILYLLFYALLRNSINAALVASFVMAFYLFFGFIHDPLRKHSIFLHRYSILLPVFLGLTVLLTLYLRKKAPFTRLSLYLNLLFLLSILYDGATLTWQSLQSRSPRFSTVAVFSEGQPACDTCAKPDIYLLVFDEYTGSRTLRDVYHYDNHGLDSFLEAQGFHIQGKSRSNYWFTSFSMASMLNMSYLNGISHPQALTSDDYTNVWEPLRKSEVVNSLIAKGYDIVNLSPFDLPGHPSTVSQPFIATNTKLITYHTLADYLERDFGYVLQRFIPRASKLGNVYKTNETVISRTIQASSLHPARPRFIYMHVALPHSPFLFDSSLHRRSPEATNVDFRLKDYLDYLPYTNLQAKQLITAIKGNSGGKAVILFMSDHGVRAWHDVSDFSYFFNNQNAVYFPDRGYSCLYDSISNVNQFRVVFNKLFRSNLPLLRDSTIFLQDSE